MITTKQQFSPITDPANLACTILDPAKAGKDLIIRLPEGIFEDVVELRLPARLKQLRSTDDCDQVITDLQRAADRVVQAVSEYCDSKTPDSILRVKETTGVYVRNVYRHLGWRFQDLVNVRDSENTSSAYLVGIPAIRHQAFEDGKLCDLMPYQVALHPSVARKLGVEAGQKVQLCRFPETRTMAVEVVVDPTIGPNCIGLPLGEPNLPKLLGGDCDGDCYAVRAYHTLETQEELNQVFEAQWKDCPDPVTSDQVLTWRDESPSGKSDGEIAHSKFMQKVVIGPVTLDSMATYIVKMAAKDRLPLSYGQLRGLMERSIEVSMDMKKCEGHDPLLFRKVINGECSLDDTVCEALEAQGYVVEDVETLVHFVNEYGGSIRKLARTNPAYDALLGDPDAVERFVATAPEDISRSFIESVFGKLRKPGPRRFHERLTRPKARYGNAFFCATLDRRTQELVVECGLAEYRIQTTKGAIRLSAVELCLFRPTVEVDIVDKEGELLTSCVLHHGWPSVVNAIARSEYAWEIIAQPNADVAKADLERLVKKVLRRLFKTYELEGAQVDRWDTVCGTKRYVVLDKELPKIEGHDFIELEMLRRTAAAEELVRRGLINYRSDTTSGNPGMAFYSKAGRGNTYVSKSDPLNCLASLKRSGVRNALGNLVEITGAEQESFVTDAEMTPPVAELNVAVLPINGMDGIVVSSAVSDRLTGKMPKVIAGLDFGSYEYHPLADGSKIQGRLDAKGAVRVIPEESMPWIRYADGTKVRAEVVMSLDSVSHEMLRHSHCTLALTAAAHRMKETTGGRMRVPTDVAVERITRVARLSGLFDSEDMTAEVLRPDGELIGSYPAGMAAIGVHRQFPSILASVHRREEITDLFPTSTASGGVVSGLAGCLCMMAEGLGKCCQELHFQINPELDAEIKALRSCVTRRQIAPPASKCVHGRTHGVNHSALTSCTAWYYTGCSNQSR